MTLVILAAGMGSRFGGLKQIEPVDKAGNFIIDYSIYDAIKAGFKKVVFIIKKENYEVFRETVGKRVEKYIQVEYAFQELDKLPKGYKIPDNRVKPWGTGHAILCAKDYVDENFAIINADDFYGREAFMVIADFLKNNHDEDKVASYAMAGYMAKNTLTENGSVKRGICQVKDGYLTKLVESSIETVNDELIATPLEGGSEFKISGDTPVSMNLFGFTPSIFAVLETGFKEFLDKNKADLEKVEYLIPTVVCDEIEAGLAKVKVIETNAVWQGITYKEDKEKLVSELAKLVDQGEYPEGLWK